MKNIEILDTLKGLNFSDVGAVFTDSHEYRLNYNSSEHPYHTIYLMDKDLNDFTDDEHKINVKYAMFVYDDNDNDEQELYVVIGQNPSHSSKLNIDGTNQNIYKALLSNEIHRYLLLNTFPIINPDGANSQDLLKVAENIKIAKNIIETILEKGVTIKIIYACGGSLPVYAEFIETIVSLIVEKSICTYAFESNNDIQMHLSMQALNSKNINPNTLKLVKCKIEMVQPKEFICVKFVKGECQ